MDKKLRKKQCREEVRKRLESLPKEYHEKASQKISEFLCGMEVFQKAGSIFCFVSTPTEVNTRSIIQHAWSGGKQVAVPRCLEKGQMEACVITKEEDLENSVLWNRKQAAKC